MRKSNKPLHNFIFHEGPVYSPISMATAGWRGPACSHIRCICDRVEILHDDREFGRLIQCDNCLKFQHLVCLGQEEDPDTPWEAQKRTGLLHFCERCDPNVHDETIYALKNGNDRIWEQRWKKWKAEKAREWVVPAVFADSCNDAWMRWLGSNAVGWERKKVLSDVVKAVHIAINHMNDDQITKLLDVVRRDEGEPEVMVPRVVDMAKERLGNMLEEDRNFVREALRKGRVGAMGESKVPLAIPEGSKLVHSASGETRIFGSKLTPRQRWPNPVGLLL